MNIINLTFQGGGGCRCGGGAPPNIMVGETLNKVKLYSSDSLQRFLTRVL